MDRARCAKLIFFAAAKGEERAYEEYLRSTVEPIDRRAREQGALLDMATLINDGSRQDGPAGWTHLRVFLFESEAQRGNVKAAFAKAAAELEPDADRRARRKAEGERMRTLLAELDVRLLD